MNFFSELFSALGTNESLLVLLFLFVSFLIGLITGYFIWGTKIAKYKKLLAERDREYNELNGKYTDLREQYDLKVNELDKAEREIEELKRRLRGLEQEKGQLHGDLMSARTKMSKMVDTDTHLALSAKYDDSRDDAASLRSQIDALNIEAGSAASSADLDALKADLAKCKSLREQQEKDLVEMAALRKTLESTKNRLSSFESENQNLQDEINRLKQQASAAPMAAAAPAPKKLSKEESQKQAAEAAEEVKQAMGSRIPTATYEERDDLKLISGVGPFIEKKLHGLGIYTFEQVSKFDDRLVDRVNVAIEFFPGRILRDNWVGQAEKFHRLKEQGTLKEYIKRLKEDKK